jgi:hypothetical protein
MLLQRVWSEVRLKNARRVGMLGATLVACGLVLATVVPSAYALACGIQKHHKTMQTASSQNVLQVAQTSGSQNVLQIAQTSSTGVHKTSTVHYVYKCSCEKDHHQTTTTHYSENKHNSSSGKKSTGNHHSSSGGTSIASHGGSGQPVANGGGSGTTPGLPFTGSNPD